MIIYQSPETHVQVQWLVKQNLWRIEAETKRNAILQAIFSDIFSCMEM